MAVLSIAFSYYVEARPYKTNLIKLLAVAAVLPCAKK